jgi:DNA-directed RNA polymerase specialized sigma24 family protein
MGPCTEQAIGKAFVTAVLLTRSAQRAEGAVTRAILSNACDSRADEILRSTVEAAIDADIPMSPVKLEDTVAAVSALPPGLRGIVQLATQLRHCMVLRVLLGWPRTECAAMLRLSLAEIDEYTSAAACALACIA